LDWGVRKSKSCRVRRAKKTSSAHVKELSKKKKEGWETSSRNTNNQGGSTTASGLLGNAGWGGCLWQEDLGGGGRFQRQENGKCKQGEINERTLRPLYVKGKVITWSFLKCKKWEKEEGQKKADMGGGVFRSNKLGYLRLPRKKGELLTKGNAKGKKIGKKNPKPHIRCS